MGKITVIGGSMNSRPKDSINTTSRSDDWSRELSPFFLPCGNLYGSYSSYNIENAWQFAKVYPQFVGEDGMPTPDYFRWAIRGWSNPRAERYPMGKGMKPLYSYWDGEKLPYVAARKRIYIPLYARAVVETNAYQKLLDMHQNGEHITLWDFDGYNKDYFHMSYDDVIECETRSMGHAFVIAMLLEGKIVVDALFNEVTILPTDVAQQEDLF